MNMDKEPASQNEQGKLNFVDDLKVSKKSYFDYSPEEREELVHSILKKMKSGEALSDAEMIFKNIQDKIYGDDDSQPKYR